MSHERALKAQAKKMNVDSLRSGTEQNAESAEMKIAKVTSRYRERTLGFLIHYSQTFYNNVFLFLGLITLGTFIEF